MGSLLQPIAAAYRIGTWFSCTDTQYPIIDNDWAPLYWSEFSRIGQVGTRWAASRLSIGSMPKILIFAGHSLAIVPFWDYTDPMRIIALSTLKAFWTNQPDYLDAMEPTLAWYRHTLHADWSSPNDVKQDFGNASILKDGRVVFNIAGNKYRLVVWINYAYRVVYIRFIGTHAQYDKIDVQTI